MVHGIGLFGAESDNFGDNTFFFVKAQCAALFMDNPPAGLVPPTRQDLAAGGQLKKFNLF
jgi:hypothetical protein